MGGSEEDADGGGRREDAEDDQAEPVDHLDGQLHGKVALRHGEQVQQSAIMQIKSVRHAWWSRQIKTVML